MDGISPTAGAGTIAVRLRMQTGAGHAARKEGLSFMTEFTPVSAATGGVLIGLAATLLMLLTGRIAGISGILAGSLRSDDRKWRIAFIAGLILAPLVAGLGGYPLPPPQLPASWSLIVGAGLLVGFGTRMAGGCTSGHGVCGLARLSPRSLLATVVFMATAVAMVAVSRHVIGG
ncbi:MAG TPA: YeeE/YedE family protein [Hyphomicrobiaceae bacterium]|nr:YeeE/YedE family protein [Hyphomicrobiaceae bacterium]